MLRNSPASVSRASSAIVPASSTPVGPPPMMTKRHQRPPPVRVGLALGFFEGEQDTPSDRRRVLQRLQARREWLPFVMPEIGVPGSGRQHQRVVGNGITVLQKDAFPCGIDAGYGVEQGRHILAFAKEVPHRPGDFRGRQRRGRHLIEQRLEQMVIAPVDDGDADWSTRKGAGEFQPAETGPYNDDMVCGHGLPLAFGGNAALLRWAHGGSRQAPALFRRDAFSLSRALPQTFGRPMSRMRMPPPRAGSSVAGKPDDRGSRDGSWSRRRRQAAICVAALLHA